MPKSSPADGTSPPARSQSTPEVVVFDMGGVLVQLASLPELLGIGGDTSNFWSRWLSSPAVRGFERGQDSPARFANDLVDELGLQISPDEFLANFSAFCTGLYPGAVDLVAEVSGVCRTALLSNTNAMHWSEQPDGDIIRKMCDHNFLSFQLGLLKPDNEIYQHVAAELAVEPDRILFLDDNQINVDGARRAGWQAAVVSGPGQARLRLAELGTLVRT